MTKIAPIEPEAATGQAAELLGQVKKAMGMTPNMTKAMATSPALLRSYLALTDSVGSGVIPAPVRERIAIATAQLNGCEYCLSAHTFVGGKVAKIDAGELASARVAISDDAHVTALMQLSNAIAENAGDVDSAAVQEARVAGVTDEEIGELVANLALNIMTNYFNILAGVENDWPLVSLEQPAELRPA